MRRKEWVLETVRAGEDGGVDRAVRVERELARLAAEVGEGFQLEYSLNDGELPPALTECVSTGRLETFRPLLIQHADRITFVTDSSRLRAAWAKRGRDLPNRQGV